MREVGAQFLSAHQHAAHIAYNPTQDRALMLLNHTNSIIQVPLDGVGRIRCACKRVDDWSSDDRRVVASPQEANMWNGCEREEIHHGILRGDAQNIAQAFQLFQNGEVIVCRIKEWCGHTCRGTCSIAEVP
jgi:hypothetical protein